MKTTYSILNLFCLLSVLLLASCAKEEPPVALVNQEEFSPDNQYAIGARLTDQVKKDDHNFPLLNLENATAQSAIEDYVHSLWQTVAISVPVTNRNNYNWDITIIDHEKQHAFTAPGGHFFIYTGLLKSLVSEAELIGIMAHEIKYIETSDLILALKDEFGGVAMGDLLLNNTVAEIDNMALFLDGVTYDAEKVRVADQLAIDILCPFLFDANGLSGLISRVSADSTLQMEWLDQRSGTDKRVDFLNEAAIDCGLNEQENRGRYKEMVEKL